MEILRSSRVSSSSRSISPLHQISPSSPSRKPAADAARSGRENTPPPQHPNVPAPAGSDAKPSKPYQPPLAANPPAGATGGGEGDGAVRVVVRVRPAERTGWLRVDGSDSLSVDGGDCRFSFDSVLGSAATQQDVFDAVGAPLAQDSLDGFNTAVVCYGESGSGKTYTMWGPPSAMVDGGSIDANRGIVPRFFQTVFAEIERRQEGCKEKQMNYLCRCSFLEVYNEEINDLIDTTQRNLQLRDEASNGIHVENLTEEYVSTADDVNQILIKGLLNRKTGATSMNSRSSRSHVIFTCIIEAWSKGLSTSCFSNSRTSRVTFVDLAGPDQELDKKRKHYNDDEEQVQKSISKLGTLVDVLSKSTNNKKEQTIQYKESILTNLLQDTIGGNSKLTFLCTVSGEERFRTGNLRTLWFGEMAKRVQNKALINEITEDDVNGLSDQIRLLKEELMRAKSGGTEASKNRLFSGKNARESLHLLRVSLNRSLVLPRIDNESEEELDVDEEDVKDLCSQISELHSIDTTEVNQEQKQQIPSDDDESFYSEAVEEAESDEEQAIFPDLGTTKGDRSPALLVLTGLQEPSVQDPTICSSPEIPDKAKEIAASVALSPSNLNSDGGLRRSVGVRASLQPTKRTPTESLAASLNHGMQIINYHQNSLDQRRSFVGLSFRHLALNSSCSADDRQGATPLLCSSCKKVVDLNGNSTNASDSELQLVLKDDALLPARAAGRVVELEAICEEQSARIKQLNSLVDQHKLDSEYGRHLRDREALVAEIEGLRKQLQDRAVEESSGDCLLDRIRTGGDGDLEKERARWTESESRWISLTEELRLDLESYRRLAEKREIELCLEKDCTAELNDVLSRAIHGHARIVEHYAELQETYTDLLEKHRRIMEGIAEVKRAAAKAGKKGRGGSAFAAALSAELSTLRIEREKERAYLKEQNRRLRVQLSDTAEAVHAAGELLVRLREAEETAEQSKERNASLQEENAMLKEQLETAKQQHAMEITAMKHYLAESRLPESALEPFYRRESGPSLVEEDSMDSRPGDDDDQSWKAAFGLA